MQKGKGRLHFYITLLYGNLFLLYSISTLAQTPTYPFKSFPLPLDLPSITVMLEDHHGFMWLGTQEGLFRFDGIHYTYYSSVDENEGLGRELITSLIEDKDHHLWVGARSGLYTYLPEQNDFEKFALSDETFPYYVHQENDSSFITHTQKGIYWFYPKSNRWEKVDVRIDPPKIFATIKGSEDDLWIGTESVVRKYDLAKKTFIDYPLMAKGMPMLNEKYTQCNSLFIDSHHQLWINTWFRGVIKLDISTGASTYFGTKAGDQKDYLLELFNPSIAEDKAGNIWLASHDAGINIYHPESGHITHIEKQSDLDFGIEGTAFGIFKDHADNLWIKSDRALHYFSHLSPIPHLITAENGAIPEASFISFIQEKDALIGTYQGLYAVNMKSKKVTNLNDEIQLPRIRIPEEQSISDVWTDKNQTLWLTSPQGLRTVKYAFPERNESVFTFLQLYPTRENFWPSTLSQLNDTTLFVKGRSNTHVFAIFHLSSGTFDYHDVTDSMLINQVEAYRPDTLLVGIRNKGLFYYIHSTASFIKIPWKFKDEQKKIQKPVFYAIQQLKNNTYALSTENYGVLLFDPATRWCEQINIAPVANSNIAFGVEEDDQHNLWISTLNQTLHYDHTSKSLIKINLATSFRGEHPFLFIHNQEALVTFEDRLYSIGLEQLFTRSEKPKLFLQGMTAGDRELNWQTDETIRLRYDENFVNYEFIALDYENPQGIRYWYQIPEISNEWIYLENRNSISLGRLSPGHYHFKVKASNDAGLWSDVVSAPEIRITPPYWLTWWFTLALVALAGGVIAYFIRLRQLKIEGELKLRNQIARDLHDDIGSTLSGIKIFSTIAADLSEDNKDLSSLLNQIRDKSDLMMQSMSDIVWSINPAYDSLQDMMIRLKQYMSEMLESQNVEVRFQSHLDLKNLKLDLKYRKDLYLALKEIINNAARHAHAHQFSFEIDKQKGMILFQLSDDGIGMMEDQVASGNGLTNIKARIEAIGGTLNRVSAPGLGTRYEITIVPTAFK